MPTIWAGRLTVRIAGLFPLHPTRKVNNLDKIICVDFQKAVELFNKEIVPYKNLSGDELLDWFDRWMDWIVGTQCSKRGAEYYYRYSRAALARLHPLGIKYEVRDE